MCTHLIKRGPRYYIRRRVPSDLVAVVGFKEVSKALGTSDRDEAVMRCRLEGVRLDAEWSALRAASQANHAITHASDTARTTVRKRVLDGRERAAEEDREYYFRQVKDEGFEEEGRERFEADVARHAAMLRAAHKLSGVESAEITTPRRPVKATTARATKAAGSLSDVIDAWATERKPQARTIRQNVTARMFGEMVGRLAARALSRMSGQHFAPAGLIVR